MRTKIIIGLTVLLMCYWIGDCSAKDKPLPFSQNNCMKVLDLLNVELRKIAPSPGQDKEIMILDTYKKIIEKKMGYSLDKTIRQAMLFPSESGRGPQVMGFAAEIIRKNPQKAFDKAYISKRTYDALNIAATTNYKPINNKEEEFIAYVTECQNKNGGICNADVLAEVLKSKNIIPDVVMNARPEDFMFSLDGWLDEKYNKYLLNDYLTLPDGSKGNATGLMTGFGMKEFVVNTKLIETSRKFGKMLEAEKAELLK
jgi:hypothetical protein